ncbi:hypothetical protein JYK14_23860, partial [Siccirubricoccus sp. KC 17139]|nr:hypothetical protein [Siccirubricoccus soli]MCP2685308.1 hypothetical protein [Siccirubricoccus soli]
LRMVGLVFLGRPRSPRGAGAQEVRGPELWALFLPAGLTVAFGLFPGALVQLAAPAIQVLAGPAARPPGGWFLLQTTEGGAGYRPLAVALLLGLVGLGLWLWQRCIQPGGTQRGAVWNCGFIDPPAHLPFGDPLTQPTAGGIAQPLRRMLGTTVFAAREAVEMPRPGETRAARYEASFRDPSFPLLLAPLARARDALAARAERLRDFTIRRNLSLAFGLLVGLLALLAWLEAR